MRRRIHDWAQWGVQLSLATILALLGAGVAPVAADDWPGFLGPGRDGLSAESGLFEEWPVDGPEVLWRAPIGAGYSSVAAVGDKVFTLDSQRGKEYAVAFSAESGEEMWRHELGRVWRDSEGGGPRTTPYVDSGRVYAVGSMAHLFCLDAASGEPLWDVDLDKEYGARLPQWGLSASPLVDADLLIVQGGGKKRSFLAFDKVSGKVVWASGNELPAYASPIVATIGDVRQAIFFTVSGLIGVALADGEKLWKAPWRTSLDVNAATPLFVPTSGVFISSGYDTGAMLVQVLREEQGFAAYQLWRSRVMRNHYGTAVRVDGQIYGFDESIFKCVEVLDGKECWRGRVGNKGSLVYADGHLILLAGDGEISLVEASPESFRPKERFRLVRARTWAPPALADGVLYVRAWTELVAVRVGTPAGGASE